MEKEEYFKYVQEYLKNMLKNKNFVIDTSENKIGGIDIYELLNLDFNSPDLADDLVCVHATGYTPKNSEIVSTEIGKRVTTSLIYQYYSHRVTVHTTLNTKVKTNNGGNFDYRRYIILVPFKEIDSKVCGFGQADTFFLDRIPITKNSVVLMNECDRQNLTEEEKALNPIFYKGAMTDEDLTKAIQIAMISMGFKPQELNVGLFQNQNNNEKLEVYRKDNHFGPYLHSNTVYRDIEIDFSRRDRLIGTMDSNNIKEMSFEIFESLLSSEIKRTEGFSTIQKVFADVILSYGIEFTEKDVGLLDTHQTLERRLKYFNQEHYEYNENYETDPYFTEQYNKYLRCKEMDLKHKDMTQVHENALYENELLSKKICDLSTEEMHKIREFDVFKQFLQSSREIANSKELFFNYKFNSFSLSTESENIITNFNFSSYNKKGVQVLEDFGILNVSIDENLSVLDSFKNTLEELNNIVSLLNSKGVITEIKMDEIESSKKY